MMLDGILALFFIPLPLRTGDKKSMCITILFPQEAAGHHNPRLARVKEIFQSASFLFVLQ